jgi:hypothetical protein
VKIAFVLVLLLPLAQLVPGCDREPGQPEVIGWVEAKRFDPSGGEFILVINGHDYAAPFPFWQQVQVGDLVKQQGGVWSIVRRRGA